MFGGKPTAINITCGLIGFAIAGFLMRTLPGEWFLAFAGLCLVVAFISDRRFKKKHGRLPNYDDT